MSDSNLAKLAALTEVLTSPQSEVDLAFETAVNLMCSCGSNGYFLRVSPSWTKALGWSAEELTSSPWISFVHPDDVRMTEAAGLGMIDGRPVANFINRYRCKDGTYKALLWNAPQFGPTGIVIGFATDISFLEWVIK